MNRGRRLAGLFVVLAAGCGHRGPLIAPLPPVPQAPREASWLQRGPTLHLLAQYRLAGLEGRVLHPPVAPQLLAIGCSSPLEAASWNTAARDREFGRAARAVPLPAFSPGQFGQTLFRLDRLDVEQLGIKGFAVLSVALADKRSRSSGTPRLVLPLAWPPLPALPRFDLEAREGGVHMTWDPPADPRVSTLRLYRWEQGSEPSWDPWKVVPAHLGALLDDTARYGQTLHYAAAAATGSGNDPVEGLLREAGPLAFRDVFPPRPPRDLDLVAESGQLRLLWNPGASPDEALAVVERQTEGSEEYREVGRVSAPDSFFLDETTAPGVNYRYRLIAIDQVGNRAEPAGPTPWLAPRPPGGEKKP